MNKVSAEKFKSVSAFSPREVIQKSSVILLQTIICSVPASIFLYTGDPRNAGNWFWALFALFGVRAILFRKHLELAGLIIAIAPLMNYLRGFAFYNVVVVIFAGGALYFFLSDATRVKIIIREKPLSIVFLFLLALYYFLSFVNTGLYWSGLRGLEFGFAMFLVLMLGNVRRDILIMALLGLFISGVAIAIGFFPYISTYQNRLGIAVINGYFLGNPITLGLPLALALLGLVLSNGGWLSVRGKPVWRIILLLICVVFLALSTSRGSWLVAGGALTAALVISGRQRVQILVLLSLVAIAIYFLLNSTLGLGVEQWVNRTIPSERANSLSKVSSGRTDQWLVGWYVLKNGSAENVLFGFGAGNGPSIYAKYSPLVPGVIYRVGGEQAWHAYFLQLAIETGLIGAGIFIAWLIIAFSQAFRNLRISKDVFPIACMAGYILITLTVSGNDTVSGIFLGLSFLGGNSILLDNAQDSGSNDPVLEPRWKAKNSYRSWR